MARRQQGGADGRKPRRLRGGRNGRRSGGWEFTEEGGQQEGEGADKAEEFRQSKKSAKSERGGEEMEKKQKAEGNGRSGTDL